MVFAKTVLQLQKVQLSKICVDRHVYYVQNWYRGGAGNHQAKVSRYLHGFMHKGGLLASFLTDMLRKLPKKSAVFSGEPATDVSLTPYALAREAKFAAVSFWTSRRERPPCPRLPRASLSSLRASARFSWFPVGQGMPPIGCSTTPQDAEKTEREKVGNTTLLEF